MRKLVLSFVALLVLSAIPAQAQTVCSADCVVLRNEPFSVAANHNGVDTDTYKLTFNGNVIQTQPVSALVNGVITFPLPQGHPTAGTYQVIVTAVNVDIDNSTAETPSVALTLTVRNRRAAPGPTGPPRIITANR